MASPSFVDVSDVSVVFSRRGSVLERLIGKPPQSFAALRNVSFQLSPGDQVTLYGKPGSGKTTLLQLLAGAVRPTSGRLTVNGTREVSKNLHAAAGYISSEEPERHADTVHDVLYGFGETHNLGHLVERLSLVLTAAELDSVASRPAESLSKTERLRLNMARAALSDAPLILLDDVADELGVKTVQKFLLTLFPHRTVIIATRSAQTAEQLALPLLLLHGNALAQCGTQEEIAGNVGCRRVVDAWVEGVRYDMLRRLKKHPGVVSVQLLPTSRFSGQLLRITLQSAHYLPSLYDALSQAPLIEVKRNPSVASGNCGKTVKSKLKRGRVNESKV
jgi:ABC-type multidrug transport system ATPase subunit